MFHEQTRPISADLALSCHHKGVSAGLARTGPLRWKVILMVPAELLIALIFAVSTFLLSDVQPC